MSEPLVTIFVPNYNKAAYVSETLRSIFHQDYKNIELIIIDDASTDTSREVIESALKQSPFPVRFNVNPENKGVSFNAELAARAANGKYFQQLSSDDLIVPTKTTKHVRILEESGGGVVYGKVKLIDESSDPINKDYFEEIDWFGGQLPSGKIFPQLLRQNFIPAPATLINREVLMQIGNYDPTLQVEDWDIWLRISEHNDIVFDDEFCAYYRIEQQSLMHSPANRSMIFDTFARTLEKHLGKSAENDKVINSNLTRFAKIIYSFGGSSSGTWLRKALKGSFSFKTLIYLVAQSLGIKYLFFKKLKSA